MVVSRKALILHHARVLAADHPTGIHYAALVAAIHQRLPDVPIKTIQANVWDLHKRYPTEFSKQQRGVFTAVSTSSRLPAGGAGPPQVRTRRRVSHQAPGGKRIQQLVKMLLADPELQDRCGDLLLAEKHFDRVIREATTVLDHRLRVLTAVTEKMSPTALVGKVLNPDPEKALLAVSNHRDEQEGFYSICKGLMLAFRNPAHHGLDDKLTRKDALRVCGLVDTVLEVLQQAVKRDRHNTGAREGKGDRN